MGSATRFPALGIAAVHPPVEALTGRDASV